MDLTLDIANPLVARRAWLAAVLAAPSVPPRASASAPLWARLLQSALDDGWPRKGIEYTVQDFDAATRAAVALSGAVGAPSTPDLLRHDDGTIRWSHKTATGTEIALVHDYDGTPLLIVIGEPEAVTRRAHAAAVVIEGAERSAPRPVAADSPEESVEVVRRLAEPPVLTRLPGGTTLVRSP